MTTHPHHKRACAVVLISHTKNPILLAKQMLLRGDTVDGGSSAAGGAQGHCVLGGRTVEKLAEEWGLEMVEERYFWTRKRWEQHRRGLGKGGKNDLAEEEDERDGEGYWGDEEGWDGKEYLPQGTVGCVVLDREGMMCVATSTGGLTNKLSGRIGDTPTIGAGFWAEEWWESWRSQERIPRHMGPQAPLPLARLVPEGLKEVLGDCLPGMNGYHSVREASNDAEGKVDGEKIARDTIRAVALSGTGNGDSFLRTAAARTAAAIAR
ncbi:MAG: hypothetical protein Q9200_007816, partial [Gallowayella weberi]